MTKPRIALLMIGVVLMGAGIANWAAAGNCMFGCWDRPTCGKVCKLVCKEKTLTAVGYGCKCNTIAVPCPSCEGCKHCECQCCPPDACGPCGTDKGDVCCGPCCPCCEAAPAKITFCWHDFFTCGGACPRTVKVLTKYQAEKKIAWYHWEVVDGCNCCGPQAATPDASKCPIVFKAAPDDAQIGDAIELDANDRTELAAYLSTDGQEVAAVPLPAGTSVAEHSASAIADASGEAGQPQAVKPAFWQRLAEMLPAGK